MIEATDSRTPLWAMTDEQLIFFIEDELTPWDRRTTAEMILRDRVKQQSDAELATWKKSEEPA